MTDPHAGPKSQFLWIPGNGPDADALARLRQFGQRPKTAMGEAWFMGDERVIYDALLETEVADLPLEVLKKCLEEIALGLESIGECDAWADWYRYLMPRSLPRAFEGRSEYLIEYLVTAFMSVMPVPSEPYGDASFKSDALATLGQAIMKPELWPRGSRASVGCLHQRWKTPSNNPVWSTASGDFSASMFFCLKYLAADDVPGWTRSLFAIPCPRWRAQVLVWLYGAEDLIDGTISQPSQLEKNYNLDVTWAWSHIINGRHMEHDEIVGDTTNPIVFLPEPNRVRFEETVKEMLDEKLLSDWLLSLMTVEPLFDHLDATGVPENLRRLYGL